MSKIPGSRTVLEASSDRRGLILAGFALMHFLATVSALFVSFSAGWDTFELGRPESLVDRVSDGLLEALSFPLVSWLFQTDWANRAFPGLLGYIPFALNSILWAAVVALGVRMIARTARLIGARHAG